jgi:hypothetical protein
VKKEFYFPLIWIIFSIHASALVPDIAMTFPWSETFQDFPLLTI